MKIKPAVFAVGSLFAAFAAADVNSQIQQLQQQITQLQAEVNSNTNTTVSTSADGRLGMLDNAFNKGSFTDFSNPLALLPDVGLSYALLQQKTDYPSLVTIGGDVEADAQAWGGSNLDNSGVSGAAYSNSGSDMAITTAKLYILANVNTWTQAFIALKGGLNGGSSDFSEAFLNFGNLSQNPLYATIGKTYLPFGSFAGNGPYANNLLTNAFRSAELNQVIFGFGKDGLNTSISLSNGQNNLNTFGYNLMYNKTVGSIAYGLGGSYLNDVRGSGTAISGAYANNGVVSAASPVTGGRNGALDFNAQIAYNFNNKQSLGLSGEWATTTASAQYVSSPNTLTDTGKMSAWNVTGNYSAPILNRSTTFSLGYSATKNMQNIPMPLAGNAQDATPSNVPGIKNQWLVFVNSQVFDNAYMGPEYARMKLYNGNYTWESTFDLSFYF